MPHFENINTTHWVDLQLSVRHSALLFPSRHFWPHLLRPLPQDRLKDLNSQADSLMTSSAFDTSQVKDKRDTINGRFQKIKSMAASRRAKLNESHRLHQFFRDMDDEESWIKYVAGACGMPQSLEWPEEPRGWESGGLGRLAPTGLWWWDGNVAEGMASAATCAASIVLACSDNGQRGPWLH